MRALCIALVLIGFAGSASALRIVVISDLNGSYGSTEYSSAVHEALKEIIAIAPDVVISTGDMVAGQRRPFLPEEELMAMWRAFHEAVTDPLTSAGIPLIVTPGNHDASAYDGFQRERRIFREVWQSRRPEQVDGDWPFAYSIKIDDVRFVSLDATTVGALAPWQMRWLRDLGPHAGPTIAFSHLPLHPFAQGRETEIVGDPLLAEIFEQIGTDVHLSGHHHAYFPGSDGDVAFVAQACLGGGPRALIGQDARSDKGFTVIETKGRMITVDGRQVDGASVNLSALPERIGVLERLDIRPTANVSPAR